MKKVVTTESKKDSEALVSIVVLNWPSPGCIRETGKITRRKALKVLHLYQKNFGYDNVVLSDELE
ncbi:MAG: hypothetical protein II897_04045 [Clostridia bacterium]|nr:hypothetical protein [Clostridia bacterium]